MKAEVSYSGSLYDTAAGIAEKLSEVIAAGARIVCESARSACPVDTGALRDSITVSNEGTSSVISANTDYAAYVEFGTSVMAPQPYLVPALIENSDAVLASMADAIESMQGE